MNNTVDLTQMNSIEEIKAYLNTLTGDELDALMNVIDYVFDENESTSRNIWIFAEELFEQTQ